MTKRYSQNQELSLYQEELLNSSKSYESKKSKEEEKTYFPDLLTPYQRALLRGETPEEVEFFNKNEKKVNKPLQGAILLCYIAGILGAIGLSVKAQTVKKAQPPFQKIIISDAQHEQYE